uniref:Paraplegin (inferred by orthology to a human protein) n=1 Tax=Strongyloides venezuelensis TaxID=75913 RepID=A0A0K0F5G4_STRVS
MLRSIKRLHNLSGIPSIITKNNSFQNYLEIFQIKYDSLYKIASSPIVLARNKRLTSKNYEKRRERIQQIKDNLEKHEDKSSNKSSNSNDDSKENDKKDPNEKNKKIISKTLSTFSKGLNIFLFGYGFYFMFIKDHKSSAENITISQNEFISMILPSGKVYQIIITPENNEAYAFVYTKAELQDGSLLQPRYKIELSDLNKFEDDIRKTEIKCGIEPSNWVEIKFKRFDDELFSLKIFLTCMIISLAYLFLKKTGKIQPMGPFSAMQKAKIKIYDPNIKGANLDTKFKDVAGIHEAKVEIMEFLDYLKNPSKYTRLGAKLPKGAIMTGPPGCGKTLLAKALAAESNVPFLNINGTEFVEMIGGLGASRVRDLFKEAKKRAPCIIYIDEIDTIGKKRHEGNSSFSSGDSEIEQTLNQLLVEMDGMGSGNGIVVFASTNRPDILDKALMRPGRFDRHISIDLPTNIERKELFELYLKKIKLDSAPSFYSGRLAQMTPGMSGADISNIVNEAAINAASNMKKVVTAKELNYALERVLAGPEKKTKTLVKEERETVAYHEAGHALVGWLLEHTDALLKVTILPRTSAALGFAQYTPRDKKLFTKEELFDRMCMMLGGRAAENIFFNRITTGAQDDLDKVTKQAYAQVKIYGMSSRVGPLSFSPDQSLANPDFAKKMYGNELARIIDSEAKELVSKAYYTAEKLIKENMDKLNILAKELLTKDSLSYEDVKRLIGPPPFGDKNVIEIVEQSLPDLEKKN